MRLLNYCFLIGGILIASCVGNSSNKSQNDKKINPADTIYLLKFPTPNKEGGK